MVPDIPIACSLTDQEPQKRRKGILQKTAESLLEVREQKNGFSYRFPADDSVLQNLATIINLERKCCPFLNFKLVVEEQADFVMLELTGRDGTKEILKSLFDWNQF